MNESGAKFETEVIYRRLTESLHLFGYDINPLWWWGILVPILIVGICYAVYMYSRDGRTVGGYWATSLAVLRISVYLLIAYMFLLPAKQTWETNRKHSRVLVLIDISESMTKIADDYQRPTQFRIDQVLDLLSDSELGLMRKLLDKNPAFVYRFGSRLDEEATSFERQLSNEPNGEKISYLPYIRSVTGSDGITRREYGDPWKREDWQAFTQFDLKPWVTKNLSPEGQALVQGMEAFGTGPGNAAWGKKYAGEKDEAVVPEALSEPDRQIFKRVREKLEARAELAGSLASGTNVPESALLALNREAGNMVQAIVLFSDGRSNLGTESVLSELRTRAGREAIPIFTIVVGEDRPKIQVRVTDVQAPDQTPPDEPFKVLVDVDGEGLVGQELTVALDLTAPGRDSAISIATTVKIAAGEPPHGQVEIVLDPKTLPDELKTNAGGKSLIEGLWKINARVPRQKDENFKDQYHSGDAASVRIEKKPLRILLFSSGPSRDFQFLLNQMLRDKADVSIFLQNEAGMKGKVALLDDSNRSLTSFPTRFKIEEGDVDKPEDKWYNLALYDVIIAFDPDWTALTEQQVQMIQTWVDLQAGGIVFVAGSLYTKQLARQDESGRIRPLLDILPVIPGDNDLARIKGSTTLPRRLSFPNIGPEEEYLKLDDEATSPTAGWDAFFHGKDTPGEGAKVLRGFHSYYPIDTMKAAAKAVAFYSDPDARMKDGKPNPYIVTMKFGQGTTMFVGSGEIWRLRQYKQEYFERFWTKVTRYVSAGSRRKQDRRGRILMSKEFPAGGYIRMTAQLLDSSLQPMPPSTEPKVTITPILLDKYETKEPATENKKYQKTTKLEARKGTQAWEGFFSRQILATPEQYPPGQWRVEVEIPSSSQPLIQKIIIKPSNPELDNTRPDVAAMAAMAGNFDEMKQIDAATLEKLRSAAKEIDAQKLAFKIGNRAALETIPECILSNAREERNRGAVEDLWDRGIRLPHWLTGWYSEKQYSLAIWMLVAIGLLSIEWLIRKLLKLA